MSGAVFVAFLLAADWLMREPWPIADFLVVLVIAAFMGLINYAVLTYRPKGR